MNAGHKNPLFPQYHFSREIAIAKEKDFFTGLHRFYDGSCSPMLPEPFYRIFYTSGNAILHLFRCLNHFGPGILHRNLCIPRFSMLLKLPASVVCIDIIVFSGSRCPDCLAAPGVCIDIVVIPSFRCFSPFLHL